MGYDNSREGGRDSTRGDNRPKELHDAVCAECSKACQVPFKPTGSKPVTCRECYAKTKPARDDKRGSFGDRRPSFDRKPAPEHGKKFDELNFKLDKIIRQLNDLDKFLNPKPEKTRNAPDNTVDHDALKDVLEQTKD